MADNQLELSGAKKNDGHFEDFAVRLGSELPRIPAPRRFLHVFSSQGGSRIYSRILGSGLHRRPAFKSWLHHLLSRRPWTSYLTFLNIHFVSCKMGITPTLQCYYKDVGTDITIVSDTLQIINGGCQRETRFKWLKHLLFWKYVGLFHLAELETLI